MSYQHRTPYQDLQNMNIVVLRGCVAGSPDVCAAGWCEPEPPDAQDTEGPRVLHEPIYFKNELEQTPQGATHAPQYRPTFVVPELGLPNYAMIYDYQKAEIYEGISHFGQLYIAAVKYFRENRPPVAQPKMVQVNLKHYLPTTK